MAKAALIGASGRMGAAIVRACAAEGSLDIVAAVASAGSKSLGGGVTYGGIGSGFSSANAVSASSSVATPSRRAI